MNFDYFVGFFLLRTSENKLVFFYSRFFKLLWANEASLASEENVAEAVGSLCRAVLSHETGSCDMWLVNDVKRVRTGRLIDQRGEEGAGA